MIYRLLKIITASLLCVACSGWDNFTSAEQKKAEEAGALKLYIQYIEEKEMFSVHLFNAGKKEVLISGEMGNNITQFGGLREINIIFENKTGKTFFSQHEYRAMHSGDTYLLRPTYFLGKMYDANMLIKLQNVPDGEYSVYAIYCQRECFAAEGNIFREKIVSASIHIEVQNGKVVAADSTTQ